MILEYTFIYYIHISPSNSILLCKALCTVHSISTQHTVGCLGAGALEQLLHSDLSELGPCTQAPLLPPDMDARWRFCSGQFEEKC